MLSKKNIYIFPGFTYEDLFDECPIERLRHSILRDKFEIITGMSLNTPVTVENLKSLVATLKEWRCHMFVDYLIQYIWLNPDTGLYSRFDFS